MSEFVQFKTSSTNCCFIHSCREMAENLHYMTSSAYCYYPFSAIHSYNHGISVYGYVFVWKCKLCLSVFVWSTCVVLYICMKNGCIVHMFGWPQGTYWVTIFK